MAMTLRFPTDLDAALQGLADAQHTSKHSLVLRAVEELLHKEARTAEVMESVERTLVRDAELLERLSDA
jgi:predicted transcriptional regulator